MRGITKMAMTSRMTQAQPSNNENAYNTYEPENRRDSRGRYAPRNEYEGAESAYRNNSHQNETRMGSDEGWIVKPLDGMERGRADNRMPQPYWENKQNGGQYRMNDGGGRMIGFENAGDRGGQMQMHYGETNREHMQGGGAGFKEAQETLDQRTAVEWVNKLENSDGSRGEHFTMEQTERLRKNKNWECDPVEFWVAMNAMWSDGVATAKKYGIDKPEYWADRAKEFLCDKDAVPGKMAKYYQHIVKHE